MTGASAFIAAAQVAYSYPTGTRRRVLDGLDLAVADDRYLLVSGASGSGKSTLVRTFNGLIPHFYGGDLTGRVTVDGQATTRLSVARLFDRVGMVFQNPEAQLFNRTVAREIAFGLESLGLAQGEIHRRVGETAVAVGIEALLQRHPQNLSGGEQQLVAVAAVVALHPRLLILDEPFANLDPANVARLRRVLAAVRGSGCGLAVCEHRLGLTAPDADQMAVVAGGRVAVEGPPAAVLTAAVESSGLERPLAARASDALGMAERVLEVGRLPLDAASAEILGPLLGRPPISGPPGETLLAVEGLTAQVGGRRVLRDVNLTLKQGEIVALVGANGAGKTTLARHLNGLARPAAGRVTVAGRDTRRVRTSELARQVGVVFQNPDSQFFKLTVAEEIQVAPRALGVSDTTWIQGLIAALRLDSLLDRAPFRLSSGEKKRVAVAAALAAQPDVLVLDEPTAGQDAHFRRTLGRLLGRLAADGRAVLMVTHDLSFAERWAHRWLVLAEGTIAAEGSPDTIMADASLLARSGLAATDRFRLRDRLAKARHG